MPDDLYPAASTHFSQKRRELAPDVAASFAAFSAQNVRKKCVSVAGKFSTIARSCSSLPTTSRPPGPTTVASSSSKRRSSSLGICV